MKKWFSGARFGALSVLALLCLAGHTASAQLPMPGWLFSDLLELQAGVAEYTDELFDFSRFPVRRSIGEHFELRDTVNFEGRKHIYDVGVCDRSGCRVARMRFQDEMQITRRDTLVSVSAFNPRLTVIASVYLAPDASDRQIARAVDSLRTLRELPEEARIFSADQDALSYALQYLFARHGYDPAPLFTPQSCYPGDRELLERCCERVGTMKIGSDIGRFVRRARFDEECIYLCESESPARSPLLFFWCDGKFWGKPRGGISQYKSWPSFEGVWRHDKRMIRVVAYRLKADFRLPASACRSAQANPHM